MDNKGKTIISIIVVALVILTGVLSSNKSEQGDSPAADIKTESTELTVYYFDVGQGDCEFITFPDGKCMLIDCGEAENSDSVVERIESLGYSRLDYVVVTHPHTDHMGGMADVISSLDIDKIYMPRAAASTRAYEKMLLAMQDKGLKASTARAGVSISEAEEVTMEFVAPCSASYDNLNNYSAALRLEYGSSSFLFTGDAEKLAELEIIDNYSGTLKSDVLKVGHHGSRYSSCTEFLKEVKPELAIISCGIDNSYGHPHKNATNRLEKTGAEIYRTDIDGDISVSTSGDGNYTVTTQCFDF